MTVAARCFCGEGWNVPAKECDGGHAMSPAEVEVFRLRAALQEAIAFAEEGWAYASDYFRDKWLYEERRCELRGWANVPDDGPLPQEWAENVTTARRMREARPK